MAIDKYKSHPSITTIKKRVRIYKQFEFSNIDLFNTISKIQALDSSKASSDKIPTAIIRGAKEVVCPYLTSCINAVINNCYFPDKLKEADVTAIHRNGNKCHRQNYRPISVLPNMSKIIERIMSEQITQHFVGILSPLLSGFRQGYNTQHALFGVIEIWKKCLDMSGTIRTIFMDLSKAYDCISHDLLIAKIEAYGFHRNAQTLVYSFLKNRMQRVKIGSTYNSAKETPEGSVLGPLLFDIFINDLFLIEMESDVCNFADDTTTYACDTSIEAVIIRLEINLHRMLQWFNDNGMKAIPSKFQIMFLGQEDMSKLCLNINGLSIPSSKQVELLGVNIDNSLKFDAQIKELCRKVNQKVHAFRRLRPFLGEQKASYYLVQFFLLPSNLAIL